MKYVLISFTLLMACGGSLSDEQRKQMREKMETNKILRITEVELTEAAFLEGRQMMKMLDSLGEDSAKLNFFIKNQAGKVRFIRPDASNARLLEKQLIDAYLSDTSGANQDNVQKHRTADGDFDSLLYTRPVTRTRPDGSDELEGVWNIWLSRRELVIAIGKRK